MIASPCRDCSNVDGPKDECAKNCPKLNGVQQLAANQFWSAFVAIDYADDIRFSLATRTTTPWMHP